MHLFSGFKKIFTLFLIPELSSALQVRSSHKINLNKLLLTLLPLKRMSPNLIQPQANSSRVDTKLPFFKIINNCNMFCSVVGNRWCKCCFPASKHSASETRLRAYCVSVSCSDCFIVKKSGAHSLRRRPFATLALGKETICYVGYFSTLRLLWLARCQSVNLQVVDISVI